jgi:hypothetical protein
VAPQVRIGAEGSQDIVGAAYGSVKLHFWVTALGQQRMKANPGRLGVLGLTYRSNGRPSVLPVHLYPPHNM